MVDENLTFKTKAAADIIECSEQSTDVHFESLPNQIHTLKTEIEATKKLTLGDFFITKHSNLGEFQVLFHYVGENTRNILLFLLFFIFLLFFSLIFNERASFGESNLNINLDSPLFVGLRNIFESTLLLS